MDESYAIRRYEQAAALLPLRWQQQARQLPPRQMARAEELRLRAGGPMTVLLPEGEVVPGHSDLPPTVTQTDLEQLCDAVTDYSRYAAGETLSRGYLTARGGFRVGVCGTAVLREGVNTNLRDISSVTVRIGREQPGLGDEVLSQLFREGQFRSTVLLSPPGLGKTTLLRDLIRGLSDGVGGLPEHRVSVVDERGGDRRHVSGGAPDDGGAAHGRAGRLPQGGGDPHSAAGGQSPGHRRGRDHRPGGHRRHGGGGPLRGAVSGHHPRRRPPGAGAQASVFPAAEGQGI